MNITGFGFFKSASQIAPIVTPTLQQVCNAGNTVSIAPNVVAFKINGLDTFLKVKFGNNENNSGYINWYNSVQDITISADGFSGIIVANSYVKNGGTSSQFLKADGSIDSNTYLTTSSASTTYFPLTGGSITGIGGNGFVGYIAQSSSPSIPMSGFRLFANSANALSWVGANGFTRTFDGTLNTADRSYVLPNASGTIALVPNGINQIIVNNSGFLSSSSIFVYDSSTGNLGIGTSVPDQAITLLKDNQSSTFINTVYETTSNFFPPAFIGRKARGTMSSPLAVQAGDFLFQLGGRGYNGAAFPIISSGAIIVGASATFSTTSLPTYVAIEITPVGSIVRREAFRVDSNGNVGIGTNAPLATAPSRRALVITDLTNDTTIRQEGSGGAIAEWVTTSTFIGIGTRSASSFGILTNGTSRLVVDINGSTFINSTAAEILRVERTTSANTTMRFMNPSNSIWAGMDGNNNFCIGRTSADLNAFADMLRIDRTSGKLNLRTGANTSVGSATLVNGTVTIANTSVTSSSIIVCTNIAINASAAIGTLTQGTIVSGTSFVINSRKQNNPSTLETADNSTFLYLIIN